MARWFCLLLLVAGGWALAGEAPPAAEDPQIEARMLKITSELRCLVCQNQTIADSNADLAKDLRREVRDMLVGGKTDEQIKEFMLARYGDFVLYRPPVKTTTVPLWIGPFVLLAIGLVVVAVMVRRRSRQAQPEMRSEDVERARKLLDENQEQQS
jgi:cytochrome c-type biogenesis protein CcmH